MACMISLSWPGEHASAKPGEAQQISLFSQSSYPFRLHPVLTGHHRHANALEIYKSVLHGFTLNTVDFGSVGRDLEWNAYNLRHLFSMSHFEK